MAEKEYIERGAAHKRLMNNKKWAHDTSTMEYAAELVLTVPAADVVEVVRCKDCKHATFYSCKNDACYKEIICEYRVGTDDENFFCSYGERKEEMAK